MPRGEDGVVLFSGVTIQETWGAMERLVDSGLVRSIGLSNFNSRQVRYVIYLIHSDYDYTGYKNIRHGKNTPGCAPGGVKSTI